MRFRFPLVLFILGIAVGTGSHVAHADPGQGESASAESSNEEDTDSQKESTSAAREGAPSASREATTRSLSSIGGDKTGVSTQAIVLPQGAGKLAGMGESFSMQLSTGIISYSVPIALPEARGVAQPTLSLSYSSGSGHGLAGVGWNVGWPYISRQTDRGVPHYDDRPEWHPEQDHFVFQGGQELVPICVVSSGTCSGAVGGEVMPSWASGWQYFRTRVESGGSYMRFFLSPNKRTWRVQGNSEALELGAPLDSSQYAGALETDPNNAARVFRWNIVRAYDGHGSPNPLGSASPAPVNVVQYRYETREGTAYLSDVYDTPPAASASSAPLSSYAHHVKLVYEARTDPTFSFRRGWRVDQTRRLRRIDVSSRTFSSATAARRLVRRLHLGYDSSYKTSLLTSVRTEGRCGAEWEAPQEDSAERFPDTTGCATLPPMTFDYSHVTPRRADGSPGTRDLPGHEGFDERLQALANSPSYSMDRSKVELFDLNSDALPDVFVSEGAEFPTSYGGFFNLGGRFGLTRMTLNAVGTDSYTNIRLSNTNVAVMDLDGDATIDLINMPQAKKQYSVYSPQNRNGAWVLQGRLVTTADQQDVRIDFGSPDVRALDANGDGLVDVVYSYGDGLRTFFALGRYPRGDGQYGSAVWTGATTSTISNVGVTKCLPNDGVDPVSFSDGAIRIGDLNGDGLQDVVRLYPGNIKYWPGRGNGLFGTGSLDCPSGTYAAGREVRMTNSPSFTEAPDSSLLRLEDVDGNGLDDLVQFGDSVVSIWLNEGGGVWTPRHVVNPMQSPVATDRMRIADLNGSGSRDILYGDGGQYRYIDLTGGVRPWLLTRVANGAGKSTDIEYSTSTAMMLAAEAGSPWESKAPLPVHVVSRVTDRDNLIAVGRPAGTYVTDYVYRDAVYDSRQREFRGFRVTTVKKTGDGNSPTSITKTTSMAGECADDEPPPAGVSSRCATDGRWVDNTREGLKGLPTLAETSDETGKYLSTDHTTYRLRKLYTGLDGRQVRAVLSRQTDTYAYDVAAFSPSGSPVSLVDVELELAPGSVSNNVTSAVTLRSTTGRAHLRKTTVVDSYGNTTDSVDAGCVEGCAAVDEMITTHSTPGRRSDDASGWQWRTVETYVTGSVNSSKRRRTWIEYNESGDPTKTTAELTGTLPLTRYHQAFEATAPAPPGAAVDGLVLLATQSYDAFGNLVRQVSPNFRCRVVKPDTDYAELPIAETVYVGALSGECGATALTSYASYDRGAGALTSVIDLHGELTTMVNDGFGRLVSMRRPSPTQLGATSPIDSTKIEYILPANPAATPYSIIHTQTQDGTTDADASYLESWAFIDGLGRTIVTLQEADPTAGDGGQWIVQGMSSYDQKGAPFRSFEPWFWSGDARAFPLGTTPPSRYTQKGYDAFGRTVQAYALDGVLTVRNDHHALSVDAWDAEDLGSGPHAGTYATERRDGHGRIVSVIERIHVGGGIESRETQTTYLATGEPAETRRVRGSEAVVRSMRYDSLGRMVLNLEPNASRGESKAWRYAYNLNGDLAGTSDARGCGANYHYDTGGRIIAEDYSPCLASHVDYSAPNLNTGDGTEAFYRYDSPESNVPTTIDDCVINTSLLSGRLVSVSDRGAKTLTSWDARGRSTCTARQVAKPGNPSDAIANRYAPSWYTQTTIYDGADRATQASTGARVAELLGQGGKSFVSTAYTARGSVKSVAGSYGPLLSVAKRDADGLVRQLVYADAGATKTDISYDTRRRVGSIQTYRGPPPLWSQSPPAYSPAPNPNGPPTSFQLLLEDVDYIYDLADNPIKIQDHRVATDWPSGAKPVTRTMVYDDLYRLSRVDYAYEGGSDIWISPFAGELGGGTDPRRGSPSPHLRADKRVLSQAFQYDWLGNTTSSTDDVGAFAARSLGTITNGTAAAGPYQLKSAAGGASPRNGTLSMVYDDAGNVVGLSLIRGAAAPCLPTGASCSQRFDYQWDEVGRLAQARRWDGSNLGSANDPLPTGAPNVQLKYAYDAADSRVLKTAAAPEGERHTVYPLASLELRRAKWIGSDYERTTWTEVPYLAHGMRLARLHYSDTSVPTLSSGQLHVFFEIPDHLGSTAIVIDKTTGELVERSTYQPYGGAESDYRPERWDSYRDDYRFSGKEEDIEVGLQYFGKRYLSATLNRWLSPDPLEIHSPGKADPNVYAYVHGRVFRATDPLGLQDADAVDAGAGPGDISGAGASSENPNGPTPQLRPDYGNGLIGPPRPASEGRSFGIPAPIARQIKGGARDFGIDLLASFPRFVYNSSICRLFCSQDFGKATEDVVETVSTPVEERGDAYYATYGSLHIGSFAAGMVRLPIPKLELKAPAFLRPTYGLRFFLADQRGSGAPSNLFVKRLGLGLKAWPKAFPNREGYRAWSLRMGFKPYDYIAPKMPDDMDRLRYALKIADQIHFNMEDFNVPSTPRLTLQRDGWPASGITEYEYSLTRTVYSDKTWYWMGDQPWYGPHQF